MNDQNNDKYTATHQKDSDYLLVSEENLTNGCEYTKISNNNALSKRRKLILHFDNRNTLQVANNVSATTVEQGVNNFLTGVLWGYETNDGGWEWISTSPSLQKPTNNPKCITYFKYVENKNLKKPSDRKIVREITGSFVNNDGARFRPYYDSLIESLRYHRLGSYERQQEDLILSLEAAQAQTEAQRLNELDVTEQNHPRRRRSSTLHGISVPVNGFRSGDGTLHHYILPSFFRLIQHLQETQRDFVIYLRTMGDDSKNLLMTALRVFSNEHPSFRFKQFLDVNLEPGRIERRKDESINLYMKFKDDPEAQIITDEFLIHEKLESGHGLHAIKDDFSAWCDKKSHYTTSKPIWFNPDDLNPRSHHILFDDNFRVLDPYDSIVDIRVVNEEKHRCYSCSFDFYPQLQNIFAVQANLYLILADEDYYIKTVEECERNFDQLLQDTQLMQEIKQKSCIDE